MPENTPILRSHQQWARLRFSVVGPVLASPPPRGELQARLQELAARKWRHPMTEQWVQFGASTIERWYYRALHEKQDPVSALQRKLRSDRGEHPGLSLPLREALVLQYRQHPSWSYQLHADNLAVLAEQKPELGPAPAYATVLRFMKAQGLLKRRRRGPVHSPGAQAAEHHFETREVRSYENPYVNGLWHLDFHHGSLRVLLENGQWAYPLLLGVLDDHSRLCCHAQWYLSEGAEELCHGLSQACEKRGLPRALLDDNGSRPARRAIPANWPLNNSTWSRSPRFCKASKPAGTIKSAAAMCGWAPSIASFVTSAGTTRSTWSRPNAF